MVRLIILSQLVEIVVVQMMQILAPAMAEADGLVLMGQAVAEMVVMAL
jgi:hypothetical protein